MTENMSISIQFVTTSEDLSKRQQEVCEQTEMWQKIT